MLSQRQWSPNGTFTIVTPGGVDPAICDEAITNLTNHRTALNTTMLRCAAGPGEQQAMLIKACRCKLPGSVPSCHCRCCVINTVA